MELEINIDVFIRIRTKTGNDLVASTFTFGPDYTVQNIESQVNKNFSFEGGGILP